MIATIHNTFNSFWDAAYDEELLIVTADRQAWLAYENGFGDWIAVRPRNEDEVGFRDDPWRPLSPILEGWDDSFGQLR